MGANSVFFEGKPLVPDAGILWKTVEEHKVTSMFITPTALRILKKVDYDGKWMRKYDSSSLKIMSVSGERCDADTFKWIHNLYPRTIINDFIGQTELLTGFCGNYLDLKEFKSLIPSLPGSVGRPFPGCNVKIIDEHSKEAKAGVFGKIVIKLPLPPSCI